MSQDQIAREAIRTGHEIIYEVAEQHHWKLSEVRDTDFFFEAVKAKIFNRQAHLVAYQSEFSN